MGKSQPSKLNLQLAPIPDNFQKDCNLGLLSTLAELIKMAKKFSELVVSETQNRINQTCDDEVYEAIDENILLISLTSGIFQQKLDVYQYHFGRDKSYSSIQDSFKLFEAEHKFLLDKFIDWLEDAKE